jgi:hypothetical protein
MKEGNVGVRNGYENLIGKPKGKRPLEKPRHAWRDNIIM